MAEEDKKSYTSGELFGAAIPSNIKDIFSKIEAEGKQICDIERVIGANPITNERVEYVILKTCPKK